MNRLSEDVLWEASYLDRVERMVRRDKNHPTVSLSGRWEMSPALAAIL